MLPATRATILTGKKVGNRRKARLGQGDVARLCRTTDAVATRRPFGACYGAARGDRTGLCALCFGCTDGKVDVVGGEIAYQFLNSSKGRTNLKPSGSQANAAINAAATARVAENNTQNRARAFNRPIARKERWPLRQHRQHPGAQWAIVEADWPKNPRALAGRLRRAQTFLRVVGIDIAFGREGRAGSRIIRIRRTLDNTVCTVSSVRDHGSGVRTTSAATGR
jgi:hypothetical protein